MLYFSADWCSGSVGTWCIGKSYAVFHARCTDQEERL